MREEAKRNLMILGLLTVGIFMAYAMMVSWIMGSSTIVGALGQAFGLAGFAQASESTGSVAIKVNSMAENNNQCELPDCPATTDVHTETGKLICKPTSVSTRNDGSCLCGYEVSETNCDRGN